MKIKLQNKWNLAFIKDLEGGWTKNSDLAHPFATDLEALFFCFNRHMKNMQIVASFADARMNFSVPVADVGAG